jgi:hypothetical protein
VDNEIFMAVDSRTPGFEAISFEPAIRDFLVFPHFTNFSPMQKPTASGAGYVSPAMPVVSESSKS